MSLLCSKPSLGSQLSQSKSPVLTMIPRSYVTHLFSHPITPVSCLLASPLTSLLSPNLTENRLCYQIQVFVFDTWPRMSLLCQGPWSGLLLVRRGLPQAG